MIAGGTRRRDLAIAAASVAFVLLGVALPWGPFVNLSTGVWVQAVAGSVAAMGAVLLVAGCPAQEAGTSRASGSQIELAAGGIAKVRSFGAGFALSVITLGFYHYFWWYFINDELRDIGIARGDQKLATSNPTNSVIAILIGGIAIVPPLISIYNTAARIGRAQRRCGIAHADTINPTLALLLVFAGGLLIVPAFVYYWT